MKKYGTINTNIPIDETIPMVFQALFVKGRMNRPESTSGGLGIKQSIVAVFIIGTKSKISFRSRKCFQPLTLNWYFPVTTSPRTPFHLPLALNGPENMGNLLCFKNGNSH